MEVKKVYQNNQHAQKLKNKTLSDECMLAVELLTEEGVDYLAIYDYTTSVKAPFTIWLILKVQESPDTIAEIVIMNPKIIKFEENIGKEASNFKDKYNVPAVVYSKKTFKI